MKRVLLLSLMAIALPMSAVGQLWRVNSKESKNGLYVDLGRVWSYNLYEASRWGVGLRYDVGFDATSPLERLSLGGWTGYGTADRRWKWGLRMGTLLRNKWKTEPYVAFDHDLTPDAERTQTEYSVNSMLSTASLRAQRFSDTYRAALGATWMPRKGYKAGAEVRWSQERRLYDNTQMMYPANDAERDMLPNYRLLEARFSLSHRSGWRGELLAGSGHCTDQGGQIGFGPYLRGLLQCERVPKWKYLQLELFGQAGITTGSVPYSRMFGLGGGWGGSLYLDRCLLTARADELAANTFLLMKARLITREPLFDVFFQTFQVGMCPRPFVMAGGAWGMLWGQNDEGSVWYDGLQLQAPLQGIAEVGIGVDGLLHWGLSDWGVALVCRLTPQSAAYHFAQPADNWLLIFTAALHVD